MIVSEGNRIKFCQEKGLGQRKGKTSGSEEDGGFN